MPRPHRSVRVLALAVAAVALAGCSTVDLSADQEAAREASRTFLQAVADSDAQAACRVRAIQGVAVADDPALLETCVSGIEESSTKELRTGYARLLKTTPRVSEVEDDTVTVTWTADEDVAEVTLAEIDGTWLVTG